MTSNKALGPEFGQSRAQHPGARSSCLGPASSQALCCGLGVSTLGPTPGLAANVLGHRGPAPAASWASASSSLQLSVGTGQKLPAEGPSSPADSTVSSELATSTQKSGVAASLEKLRGSGLARPHPHRAKPWAGQGLPLFIHGVTLDW